MMTWWQDFKAWRREEVRTAPAGSRGRIYAKRGVTAQHGAKQIAAMTEFKVTARVIRADGSPDEFYDLSGKG